MRTNEPPLRDPSATLRQVFGAHGRLRYQNHSSPINGAVQVIQPSDAFMGAGGINSDVDGEGAVYAWFVGSPRAFLFGFTRTQGWAVRKMRETLQSEFSRERT
jgi:hypothetical protein